MPNIANNTEGLRQAIQALQNKTAGGESGGTDTSDATATSADLVSGKTAYAQGVKITGVIPIRTSTDLTASGPTVTVASGYYSAKVTKSITSVALATPGITINASGLITATVSQASGYVASSTKSGTKQLAFQSATTITPSTTSQTAVSANTYVGGAITVAAIPDSFVQPQYTKAATTYTPTTANQTISAGTYLTGVQTIKGDTNLVASNIKSGVTIFGVSGTHQGGSNTSDATATAEDIVTGKTAYGANGKLTGTNPYAKTITDNVVDAQSDLIAEITSVLRHKAAGGAGTTEIWTFTLEDDTEIQKEVVVV